MKKRRLTSVIRPVASSVNSAPSSVEDSLPEIEQALHAFRAATGLLVCFKLLQNSPTDTQLSQIGAKYGLHRSTFCMGVKATLNERCRECDLRTVPERCNREKQIFSHVCHAGAGEVIIPIFVDENLVAVTYIGQFRLDDTQPLQLTLLTTEQHTQLVGLSRLLGAYLTERIRLPRFVSETSVGYRRDAINRYLDKTLREGPTLPGLAKHLGLSTTRTAHAVREVSGMSFVELRDELRLRRARDLLQHTYYKVPHIASECGFSSSQYFHRFFREKTSSTPMAFRQRHRARA